VTAEKGIALYNMFYAKFDSTETTYFKIKEKQILGVAQCFDRSIHSMNINTRALNTE
jgi:hypothetical protein